MKLPLAPVVPDAATLWRRYADLLFDRALAFGDEIEVPHGRGVVAGEYRFVLPADASAATAEAAGEVLRGAAGDGFDCTCIEPPGAEAAASSWARGVGAARTPWTLHRLHRSAATVFDDRTVLPGRSARAAYTRVCRAVAADDADAERRAAHLDDPQCDPMVALVDGEAVGTIALQTRGQTGGIFDWFVVPTARRRGIGTDLMGRASELAARSQLADVMIAAPSDAVTSRGLLRRIGFVPVVAFAEWTIPVKHGPLSRVP